MEKLGLASGWQGRTWLCGLASLVFASGWTKPASACGACECSDAPVSIVTLIRDVPLNLRIPLPVLEGETTAPRLERVSDLAEVPSSATQLEGALRYWWLAVETDLDPRTDYRIVRSGGVEAQFTTGTARDEAAPTFGSASSTAGGNADLCSESVGARLAFGEVEDAGSPSFTVWAEVEVTDGADALRLFAPYGPGGSIRVGHSGAGCFGSTEIGGLVHARTYPTRARLRDAAGNASEWEEVALTVAGERPGGCGTPSGGGDGGGAPSGAGASPAGGSAGAVDESPATDRTSSGCEMTFRGGHAPARSLPSLVLLSGLLLCRRRAGWSGTVLGAGARPAPRPA